MFKFRKYEISDIMRFKSADVIKVSLEDEDASYFVSNTSLGFLPKRSGGVAAVSEYILGGNDKVKYLCEVKRKEEVMAYKNNEIFLSRVRNLETIKNTEAMLIKVKTGRNLYDFPFFPQKYSTSSLKGDMIGEKIVAFGSILIGDSIQCLEDIKQEGTHFGMKLEEFLIEV